MIKRVRIQQYKVRMICSKDCAGEMFPTGVVLRSVPAQFPHQCAKCKRVENFPKTYPHIEEKELEEPEELPIPLTTP